jgi:hypothetical protein
MPQITLILDTDKLNGRLSAAQAADWMAKFLFTQVDPEQQENLRVWGETLGVVIRERIMQAEILARNNLVAMTAKERVDFEQKVKALGFQNVPKVRPQVKATVTQSSKKPEIDLFSEELFA